MAIQKRTDPDDELVARTVRELNLLSERAVRDLSVEAGDNVIKGFYGGDLDEALSHRPHKPAALAKLMHHKDLKIRPRLLRRCVAIAAQYHLMPRAIADALSNTHHEMLLPVKDLDEKIALAKDAVARGLSADDLQRKVRQKQRKHAGGRPPKPDVVKLGDALTRLLIDQDLDDLFSLAKLRDVPIQNLMALDTELDLARARLAEAHAALQKRLKS